MALVGVISDTHGSLHEKAYEALADCDHIIHAGDICGPRILRELETLAPVTAVLGNNDFDEYGSNVQRIASVAVDGVKFRVAHYPQEVVRLSPGEVIPDIFIHGHTHVPRLEFGAAARSASYILNPGSPTRPRGGNQRSIAKIGVAGGRVEFIRIETLAGKPITFLDAMA